MQAELYCTHCHNHFTAPDASAAQALQRITQEGPWCALGDGETFEDHLSAALNEQEPIYCPECGRAVTLDEESLGRLSSELLANW